MKVLSFDVVPVKQSFFSACNCIYSKAKDIDEIVNLSLQESYCLPVLTYAVATLKLTVKQEDELNACWNTVYRKIFGFHKWESVKCFIWGLGRLDLHHIILQRKFKFYLHLLNSRENFLCDIFWIFSEINFANDSGLRLFLKNWFGSYVDIVELFQSTLLC
jgi:hypothetical protein